MHDALAEFLGGIGVALPALAVTWVYRQVKAATRDPRPGDTDTIPEPQPSPQRPGGHETR
ncbi:hypothetical protein [Streptomyces hydrogenans]|uniref:hypothetical protein n=1 Tax=Streptomyces hydrogenans TaxID=1873719 RepID=UPI0038292AF9